MLAQNFKRPTDLRITDRQFDALAKVLGMLERDEIPPEHLDMDMWHCGSVHCIGGWADVVAGDRIFGGENSKGELFKLFFPPRRWSGRITPPQAAIALRNYLTHGKPRWAEALSA